MHNLAKMAVGPSGSLAWFVGHTSFFQGLLYHTFYKRLHLLLVHLSIPNRPVVWFWMMNADVAAWQGPSLPILT